MTSEKGGEHKVERDNLGRDIKILDKFEFADYLMRDILYYHMYVNASQGASSDEDKILRLPEVLPLTHVWDLTYSPQTLVEKMNKQLNFLQARSSLLSLIPIFEATLKSFVKRLKIKLENEKYGCLLNWAFKFVVPNKESLYSGPKNEEIIKMIEKVPDLCLNVDEARRLRNVFMHKRGFFDKEYGTSAVEVPGKQAKMRQEFLSAFLPVCRQKIPAHFSHKEFTKYMKKFIEEPEQDVPVLLKPEEYIEYSRSHIGLLHVLHDLIQRTCFDLKDSGYSYKVEQERLKPKWAEWDCIFLAGDCRPVEPLEKFK